MKMGFELLLLCALIFIFLVSFCGLIQKIKQSYERERLIAERLVRQRQAASNLPRYLRPDAQINVGFVPESDSGIYPSSPPPYSHICPPPKYEDIIKDRVPEIIITTTSATDQRRSSAPPPYTVSVV